MSSQSTKDTKRQHPPQTVCLSLQKIQKYPLLYQQTTEQLHSLGCDFSIQGLEHSIVFKPLWVKTMTTDLCCNLVTLHLLCFCSVPENTPLSLKKKKKKKTLSLSMTTPQQLFYSDLFSGSHMLAPMDHPNSSHPIFHFTAQIPLSSSLHPLHILTHPRALLFSRLAFSPNLSLLSPPPEPVVFFHVYSTHPSDLLTCTLSADWMSYCLATLKSTLPQMKKRKQKTISVS